MKFHQNRMDFFTLQGREVSKETVYSSIFYIFFCNSYEQAGWLSVLMDVSVIELIFPILTYFLPTTTMEKIDVDDNP